MTKPPLHSSQILTSVFYVAAVVATSFIFAPSPARSETFAKTFPIANQAMISIYRPPTGGSDADAKALFEAIDMIPQDSILGPGKGIKDANQVLSWVCADRGTPGFHCTITIRKDAKSSVRDNPIRVSYRATGADAADLAQWLKPNQSDGSFKFTNAEGTLSILSSAASFKISFQE